LIVDPKNERLTVAPLPLDRPKQLE